MKNISKILKKMKMSPNVPMKCVRLYDGSSLKNCSLLFWMKMGGMWGGDAWQEHRMPGQSRQKNCSCQAKSSSRLPSSSVSRKGRSGAGRTGIDGEWMIVQRCIQKSATLRKEKTGKIELLSRTCCRSQRMLT